MSSTPTKKQRLEPLVNSKVSLIFTNEDLVGLIFIHLTVNDILMNLMYVYKNWYNLQN